jgi:hypothetical protein
MGMLERLNEFINAKGFSMKAFEESVGMSNGSLGTTIKNGQGIRTDKLENILSAYPELSAEWLLRGVGSMIIGKGKAMELEQKIVSMSQGRDKDKAYDIVMGVIDMIDKTYDFYKEK